MSKEKVINTPIKIQGKKRNIIPFLKTHIQINQDDLYIEPFLGSGIVAFNLHPNKAILSDVNYHIINLYNNINNKKINSVVVRDFLEMHGSKLAEKGESYYYEMRQQFNDLIQKNNNNYYEMLNNNVNLDLLSLYFIFLNFSCFNGAIRFNGSGLFNTPFCRKDDKYSKSYITKICNQISDVQSYLKDKDWKFIVSDYQDILNAITKQSKVIKKNKSFNKHIELLNKTAPSNTVVYLDPPYIDTHNNYYKKHWLSDDEKYLYDIATNLDSIDVRIYLSNWLRKIYPIDEKYESNIIENDAIVNTWLKDKRFSYHITKHKYVIASKVSSRSDVEEILIYNHKNKNEA